MRVYGLSMVRNEVDVVRLSVLHHLSLGFDKILIVDNGSSDGTAEQLQELGRDPRVRWSIDNGPYRQAEIITALAREACKEGADWIVPFDGDEFWHAPSGGLRRLLSSSAAGALEAAVTQFVQRRGQRHASPYALRHMTWRPPAQKGSPSEDIRGLVESREIAYIEMLYPPKMISRCSPTIEITKGNHSVRGVSGPILKTKDITCLHAPLRSRAALEKKVAVGERSDLAGRQGMQSWHLLRWQRLNEQSLLESEWAANSQRRGRLDVYGDKHQLVFDSTLRDLVAPFMPRRPRKGLRTLRRLFFESS